MSKKTTNPESSDSATCFKCPTYPENCDHVWVLPDGVTEEDSQEAEWPLEYCEKCGMSMIRHFFTECP